MAKLALCTFATVQSVRPKIVLTGPESSGKTALAAALSNALQEAFCPEFARFFVGNLGRAYTVHDLKTIGAGQKTWENWYGARARAFALCDTDWTVLHVWETYRFGTDRQWRLGYGAAAPADLYLLCSPDFAWQPDPLREHPDERNVLFGRYESLMRSIQAPFIVLRGSPDQRLSAAMNAIRKI